MIFDDHKIFLNSNDVELHNNLCNEFDSYCFIATMFKEKELHVEFCQALLKASALVEQIFQVEHLWILICFFEVFIHFIQSELFDVDFVLRDFIKKNIRKYY